MGLIEVGQKSLNFSLIKCLLVVILLSIQGTAAASGKYLEGD